MAVNNRIISFTITSSPNGASILLDGNETGFITPYILYFQESELLTPKNISVINGTNKSNETYVISSEIITNTTKVMSKDTSLDDVPTSTGGITTSTGGITTRPLEFNENIFRPEVVDGPRDTLSIQ